jgi:hypothetical protein
MINRTRILTAAAAAALLLTASVATAGRATRVEDALWGAGVTWDTVLTPTTFVQPPSHSVDLLFNFSMSGLSGQRAIASNVPGDRDYNGGRWWVHMVVFTTQGLAAHDPDGDGVVNFELTSAEELADHIGLGHLQIFETSNYFECPMLRSR